MQTSLFNELTKTHHANNIGKLVQVKGFQEKMLAKVKFLKKTAQSRNHVTIIIWVSNTEVIKLNAGWGGEEINTEKTFPATTSDTTIVIILFLTLLQLGKQ